MKLFRILLSISIIFFTIDLRSSQWGLIQQITGTSSSGFAGATSINQNGTFVAVGEQGYNSNQGRVKIYKQNVNNNVIEYIQYGSDITSNGSSLFGFDVAINLAGNIVAVSSKGSVQIYEYIGSDWVQKGANITTLDNTHAPSIAINGDGTIIVMGEPHYNSDHGAVSVYEFTTNWTKIGSTLSSTNDGLFGWDVDINSAASSSDMVIIIGEQVYNVGNGRVQVYQYPVDSDWHKLGSDILGDPNAHLGASVAINEFGFNIACGEPGYNSNAGRVRSYRFNGDWEIIGHDNDMVGIVTGSGAGTFTSMNQDGTVIVVADKYRNRFRVYRYDTGTNTWYLFGDSSNVVGINVNNTMQGSYVDISSDARFVLLGEPSYSSNKGRVRIYKKTTSLSSFLDTPGTILDDINPIISFIDETTIRNGNLDNSSVDLFAQSNVSERLDISSPIK